MKSSYENVPPLKEALSSMRCQKKRDSSPWSPSRTMVTLANRHWGVSSSRRAETRALRREAKSLPIFCSPTCDMSTPSNELIPNKELSMAGSDDLPTHRNMSTPLSSKKIPLLANLSTVRLSKRGNKMRSCPQTLSMGASFDGSPALGLMSCSENIRGYTKCFVSATPILNSKFMAWIRSSG